VSREKAQLILSAKWQNCEPGNFYRRVIVRPPLNRRAFGHNRAGNSGIDAK